MYKKGFVIKKATKILSLLNDLVDAALNTKLKFQKTFILILIVFFIPLLNTSCKTCKCPAYSKGNVEFSSNNDILTS